MYILYYIILYYIYIIDINVEHPGPLGANLSDIFAQQPTPPLDAEDAIATQRAP